MAEAPSEHQISLVLARESQKERGGGIRNTTTQKGFGKATAQIELDKAL